MKLKNIIMTTGFVAAMSAMIGGCGDDFLDTPVQNALSPELLASTQSGVEASLISTYKMLNGFTNTVGNTWGSAPSNYIYNSASDDVHKGSEQSDNPDGYFEVSLYQWSPGFLVFTHKFQALYEGVRRANNTIQLANIHKANGGSATEVDRIISEAKFLRTFYHFEAYKMWKNVPYYDETITTDFQQPNTADILPKLITDLSDANIAKLKADKAAAGRVDQTVAKALRGKIYLFQKSYALAKADFDAVRLSNKYQLATCYNDLFTNSLQNGKESIFAQQASINDGDGNASNSNFLERLAAPHTGSVSGCCGFNNPTQDLANAYQVDGSGLPIGAFAEPLTGTPNPWNATRATVGAGSTTVDPRIDWVMGRTGVPYLDWGLHSDGWIRGSGWAGLYSPKKNMKLKADPSGPGWTTGQLHSKNVELIRYADVLLMLAECEVELDNYETARGYVNQVRARAANCAQGATPDTGGLLTIPIDDASITWATYDVQQYPGTWTVKADARNAVRRERRLELATEGHRLFDLRRWGILEHTVTAYRAYESTVTNLVGGIGDPVKIADLDTAVPLPFPSTKFYVFPLPSVEVDLSGGKLVQNTGF